MRSITIYDIENDLAKAIQIFSKQKGVSESQFVNQVLRKVPKLDIEKLEERLEEKLEEKKAFGSFLGSCTEQYAEQYTEKYLETFNAEIEDLNRVMN